MRCDVLCGTHSWSDERIADWPVPRYTEDNYSPQLAYVDAVSEAAVSSRVQSLSCLCTFGALLPRKVSFVEAVQGEGLLEYRRHVLSIMRKFLHCLPKPGPHAEWAPNISHPNVGHAGAQTSRPAQASLTWPSHWHASQSWPEEGSLSSLARTVLQSASRSPPPSLWVPSPKDLKTIRRPTGNHAASVRLVASAEASANIPRCVARELRSWSKDPRSKWRTGAQSSRSSRTGSPTRIALSGEQVREALGSRVLGAALARKTHRLPGCSAGPDVPGALPPCDMQVSKAPVEQLHETAGASPLSGEQVHEAPHASPLSGKQVHKVPGASSPVDEQARKAASSGEQVHEAPGTLLVSGEQVYKAPGASPLSGEQVHKVPGLPGLEVASPPSGEQVHKVPGSPCSEVAGASPLRGEQAREAPGEFSLSGEQVHKVPGASPPSAEQVHKVAGSEVASRLSGKQMHKAPELPGEAGPPTGAFPPVAAQGIGPLEHVPGVPGKAGLPTGAFPPVAAQGIGPLEHVPGVPGEAGLPTGALFPVAAQGIGPLEHVPGVPGEAGPPTGAFPPVGSGHRTLGACPRFAR